MSDAKSRFRITAAIEHWPGQAVPVPPVMVLPVELTDGGFLEYSSLDLADDRSAWITARRPIPDELYLREFMSLDLEDSGAVLDFARRYGRLETPGWRDLPTTMMVDEDGPVPTMAELDALTEAHHPRTGGGVYVSHLEVFALHARVLRDIVRMWVAFSEEGSLASAVEAWESPAMRPAAESPEVGVAILLPLLVDPALQHFHVRCVGHVDGGGTMPDDIMGSPHPSVYAAMALQLANHIAESATYRRCHAEGCGRLFVNQQGRSKYGQHRSRGLLKYCSDTCANRQAQRDYRRRKRMTTDVSDRKETP